MVLAIIAVGGLGQRVVPPLATAASATGAGARSKCADNGTPFQRPSCSSGPSPASKGLKWLGNALDDGAEATAGAAAGGVGALSCTLTGQAFTSGGCDPSATEAAVKGGLMGIYGFLKPDASDGIVGALTSVFKPAKVGAVLVKHLPDAERFVKKALGLCRSFSGDTLVLMGDGSLKPIRQIRVGDVVAATDPRTGKRSKRRVTGIGAHLDRLYRLDIAGETLRSTDDHPFWNAADQAWQDAGDLDTTDTVLTADGRLLAVGGGLRPLSGQNGVAYNLAVEGVHTYHVGRASVLVHNSGACKDATAPRLPRFGGPKPTYEVNPAHVPGRGLRRGKTPLPQDAEEVYRRAVPNDPANPTAWFGLNRDGRIYRYSMDNVGGAHFSGIDGVGDGARNLSNYARRRLAGE